MFQVFEGGGTITTVSNFPAFEKSLNSSFCLDPTVYGWRVDPNGCYVKKYLPELADMPVEYVYSPWKAPLEV